MPTSSNTYQRSYQHFKLLMTTEPHLSSSIPHTLVCLPLYPPTTQKHTSKEITRTTTVFPTPADGFAVRTVYNGVWPSGRSLDPTRTHLERAQLPQSRPFRPTPLIEVAFDTARTVVDVLYSGWFRRYPDIRLVIAYAGGSLPALSGHLALLGSEEWYLIRRSRRRKRSSRS